MYTGCAHWPAKRTVAIANGSPLNLAIWRVDIGTSGKTALVVSFSHKDAALALA